MLELLAFERNALPSGGDTRDNLLATFWYEAPWQRIEQSAQREDVAVGRGPPSRRRPPWRSLRGTSRGRRKTALKTQLTLACAYRGVKGRRADIGPRSVAGKPAAEGISRLPRGRRKCRVKENTASNRTPNPPHPAWAIRTMLELGTPTSDPIRREEGASRDAGPARCPTLESLSFRTEGIKRVVSGRKNY